MTSPDMTTPHTHVGHDDHDDFGGAARDLVLGRRAMFRMAASAGVGLVALAACGGDDSGTDATTPGTDATGTTAAPDTTAASTTTGATDTPDTTAAPTVDTSTPIPEETGGPYPGDGSNGPDILEVDGVVRSDIRTSIGDASGTAEGVPLTVALTLYDSATGLTMPGAAVYLWHATRDGEYSMYSANVANDNFLRGVQAADDNGVVTFQTIYPGCYDGRWPHIHFEVYPSVDDALAANGGLSTSQLAFPQDTCEVAYTAVGYEQSADNLTRVSLATDMVFADGWDQQLAAMSGDNASGWAAALNVVV